MSLTVTIFIHLKLRGAEIRDLIFYLPYCFVTPKSAWKDPQNNHQSVTCVTKTVMKQPEKHFKSYNNSMHLVKALEICSEM